MCASTGGALASRRRPLTSNCVPRGRTQYVFCPFTTAPPANSVPPDGQPDSGTGPAHSVRPWLMYQFVGPNGSAPGSVGGTSRIIGDAAHDWLCVDRPKAP